MFPSERGHQIDHVLRDVPITEVMGPVSTSVLNVDGDGFRETGGEVLNLTV